MNPAALKADLATRWRRAALIILNEDAFTQRNLEKAGYAADPSTDGSLDGYQVYRVPDDLDDGCGPPRSIGHRQEGGRAREEHVRARASCRGCTAAPPTTTLNWLERKFGGKQEIYEANVAAFKAGYNFGETTELFAHSYVVKAAPAEPGTYRNVAGATALAWGLIAASAAERHSAVLRQLPDHAGVRAAARASRHKNFGVITLQAEDEIAAANVALGASFAGHLAVTGTSGPGHGPEGGDPGARRDHGAADHHRGRAARRPVHRHADQDRAGRPAARRCSAATANRRCPCWRRSSPSDCFAMAMEAARIAVRYRTPVILLSDTLPVELLRAVAAARRGLAARDRAEVRRGRTASGLPAVRARRASSRARGRCRARPGLVHRIGGLEREDLTGNISYDAENHERMTHLRADEGRRASPATSRALEVEDPDGDADLLVLGWGSSLGTIRAAARARAGGGTQGRHGAPAPPEPVPGQHGRRRERLPEGV